MTRSRRWAATILVMGFPAGCASVAQVTSFADSSCRRAFTTGLAGILEEQGEAPPVAQQLSERAADALQTGAFGPRPFLVASSSGADYSFFVERKEAECLLRLYGRQKGFVAYSNNLTYIASRPLAPCRCAE